MKSKTHVRKGDSVEVIAGNHKGASGTIQRVDVGKDQVYVTGVRLIKKHIKPTQEKPEGGIEEREGPIHISNVKLVQRLGS
ncbi:MAG: 50S ribosomal protein L24 [Verrucomicrobiota bacterium]